VEKLWKTRGYAVDRSTDSTFFGAFTAKIRAVHCVYAPSSVLSLAARAEVARMLPSHDSKTQPSERRRRHVNVHRFAENINGREYLIEVSNVGTGQWRAQIKRTPGGSAALMPFYGKTPDEAAGQLSRWLAIAHGLRRC
jgi:hypothetical protein